MNNKIFNILEALYRNNLICKDALKTIFPFYKMGIHDHFPMEVRRECIYCNMTPKIILDIVTVVEDGVKLTGPNLVDFLHNYIICRGLNDSDWIKLQLYVKTGYYPSREIVLNI